MSSTGDMERDVTLVTKKIETNNKKNETTVTSNSTSNQGTDRPTYLSPFVMPRKVADVFVVMK